MKILDLIKQQPKNQPITDKRILYHLKRLGYIWDYSQWGYLECARIKLRDDTAYPYLFEHGNSKELHKQAALNNIPGLCLFSIPLSRDEFYEKYSCNGTFTFEGFVFGSTYVDGCFKSYLVLI